ncbi:MAG: ACP S-malonyltransferase [Anaerolineales bacterium]|nr:ACP S-malonyltransferase [Anaerolineales bacterium]
MDLSPHNTAFLFPGQGSQAVGMGAELAAEEPSAAAVFARADELLGFELSDLCWNGPEDELNDTVNTQPALLVHSVAVLRALQARQPDFKPAMVAGHSLGEYTALVAAGSLSFEHAVQLVRTRGEAMKAAGQEQPGGMAAVLGLESQQVEEVCEAARERGEGGVWVANDNCPGQIVISGDGAGLDRATQLLEDAGARKVVRLAVSIAAHSPYMQAAQDRLRDALQGASFDDPEIPVIGNVSAAPLSTAAEVRADLDAQLTANVRWTDSVRHMLEQGVHSFVELGSGDVLTGLVRRIDRSAERYNLDSPASFSQLLS